MPDYAFLDDPAQARFHDMLDVRGNYELVVDNLLDLSHVEYLHPMLAQSEGVAAHRTEFFQEGDTVISNRWRPKKSRPRPVRSGSSWESPSERADTRTNMRWSAPARLLHDLGATEIDAPIADGFTQTNVAHLITPETALSSHYFWGCAYNRRRDDPEVLHEMRAMTRAGSSRPKNAVVIEAQQRAMGTSTSLVAQRPVMLEPDEPARFAARRILAAPDRRRNSALGRLRLWEGTSKTSGVRQTRCSSSKRNKCRKVLKARSISR